MIEAQATGTPSPELVSSVVLVTGGTGSFGSTMVRRLLAAGVPEIRILSRDELKQHEMRVALDDARVKFLLGDVRDLASVVSATRGVDLIFHAAALKQVPSCEFFPLQAVQTNVIGSSNVLEAASASGVRSVVCLGTDKAVQPINAMGMSKALMEKTVQAFARNNPGSATTVSAVRYGNVMCSRGSVIPLFVDQVRRGLPMTVTDPQMTRFLMSLDEALALVEHAFDHAHPGDLFVRKARPRRSRCWRGRSPPASGSSPTSKSSEPTRREGLRDAGHARGAGAVRRPGRLLPGAGRLAGPQLRRLPGGG
jgi:UDP-glucose 4-epimerase